MALSANRDVNFYTSQELIEIPLDDDVNIYKGALVGLNSSTGYARPLTAGDDFLGVAYAQADNTGTGHAAAAINVKLHQNVDVVHSLAGVAVTDTGSQVYASDDGTLTLTSTNNTRVGRIVGVESSGVARVRLQPVAST
jgi:hypothetical protein